MRRRTVALILICASAFTSAVVAKDNDLQIGTETVKSIDVADLLYSQLKIRRKPRSEEGSACPNYNGGPGMHPRVYCKWFRRFKNLSVEKTLSVLVGDLDPSKILNSTAKTRVDLSNSWSDKLPYQNTITVESVHSATLQLTETLQNVTEFKSTFGIDAKISNAVQSVGVNSTAEERQSITYSLTNGTTDNVTSKVTMTQPINIDIPPCTRRWMEIGEQRRSVRLPVTIIGTITGDVVDWDEYSNRERNVRSLNDYPAAKRTFQVHGFVDYVGGERNLSVVGGGEETIPSTQCKPRSGQ